MYCHGMAALALSEAYAHDRRPPARSRTSSGLSTTRSTPSTRVGGGWRYQPGDPGDTSQFGWQLMALAQRRAGRHSRSPTRRSDGMIRFLRSVSSGEHGGLASYRPGERPSRTMTAEALVCRFFLDLDRRARRPSAKRPTTCWRSRRKPAEAEPVLLVLRHVGPVPAAGRPLGPMEPGAAGTAARARSGRGRRPAVGTRTRSGAATAAASTARPWRRSAWRSTTATCRSTRPRSEAPFDTQGGVVRIVGLRLMPQSEERKAAGFGSGAALLGAARFRRL